MYVIVRISDNKYVAEPGREHSYTNRLEDAVVYRKRDDAERNCCPGNECVLAVSEVMQEPK